MWRGMGCKAHVDHFIYFALATVCGPFARSLLAAIAQCQTTSPYHDRSNNFVQVLFPRGDASWRGLTAGGDAPRSGAKLVLGTLNGYSRL